MRRIGRAVLMAVLCGTVVAGCDVDGDRQRPPSGERRAPAGAPETGADSSRRDRAAPPGRRSRRHRFPRPSRTGSARVTAVSDGDTVSLSGIGRVRLIGVDTPEVFGGAECYGREASAFTKRILVPGRRVAYRLGVERRDRFGRTLAYVWLRDGRLFNGLLVERGYAVPLTVPPNVELARRFVAAARRARRAKLGLWSPRTCAGDGDRLAGGRRRAAPANPGSRGCSDFTTQAEAQRHFARRGGRPGRNADHLDGDGDGRACESLP